jgi:uncharacterized protein YlxW (UPF0749 family)
MKMEWIITGAISVITTLLGFIVNDRLFKASAESKIIALQKENELQQEEIELLQEEYTKARESLVLVQQKLFTIDENFKELKKEMREDNAKMNETIRENTLAISKLDGTLQVLGNMLKMKQL